MILKRINERVFANAGFSKTEGFASCEGKKMMLFDFKVNNCIFVKTKTMIVVGSFVKRIQSPTPLYKEDSCLITTTAKTAPFIPKNVALITLIEANFLVNIPVAIRACDNLKNLVIP